MCQALFSVLVVHGDEVNEAVPGMAGGSWLVGVRVGGGQ